MDLERPLDYQELLTVLRGDGLNSCERQIANLLGQTLIPGWGDSNKLHMQLNRAQVSAQFLQDCYLERRAEFIRFTVDMIRGLKNFPDPGEEYPVGEEPDLEEDFNDEQVLGVMQGFSLNYVAYYRFFLRSDDALLTAWLKYMRIPHSTSYRRELKSIFAALAQQAV